MKIEKVITEDYVIINLRGEFDTIFCPKFNEEVEHTLESGVQWIILNLRYVRFINSTALGAIIKAKKLAQSKEGDLVISKPSSFCKDVLEKVGLDRLIKVFDDDEAAAQHILNELGEERDPVEGGESPLLFWFAEQGKNALLPRGVAVARLVNLDENTIELVWNHAKNNVSSKDAAKLFSTDSDFRVKFRIPIFSKEYFEVECACREARSVEEGKSIQVVGRFTFVDDAHRQQIKQFLQDMRYLKETLHRETNG